MAYNFEECSIHLILRDNALNMEEAMRDAVIPRYGCFAHNLQLVINDGVWSNGVQMSCLQFVDEYSIQKA